MAIIVLSIGEDHGEHLSVALHKQIAGELTQMGHEVRVVEKPFEETLKHHAIELSKRVRGRILREEELIDFFSAHLSRSSRYEEKLREKYPDAKIFSLHDAESARQDPELQEVLERTGVLPTKKIEPGDHLAITLKKGRHYLIEVHSERQSTPQKDRERIKSFLKVPRSFLKAENFDDLRLLVQRGGIRITESTPLHFKVFKYLLTEADMTAAEHFDLVSEMAAKRIAERIHGIAVGKEEPPPFPKPLRPRKQLQRKPNESMA